MKITYERLYYGNRDVQTPPETLRRAAEALIPMLHPDRRQEFAARERADGSTGPLLATAVQGNPAWIVTFTPEGK